MNYQKIYDDICKRGQERILPEGTYVEKHHIVPKCLGGGNEKSNITPLTAREHFLVHYILTRIYPNNSKIWNACFKMCHSGNGQKRFIPNSRLYEFIKIELNKLTKGKTYEELYGIEKAKELKEKISKKLVGKIVSEETKQRMCIAQQGIDRLGKKIHSEEQKEKWSRERSGEGSFFFGKKLSPESIRKRTESRDYTVSDQTKELLKLRKKEFFDSEKGDEYRKNYSIRFSGENGSFFGKSHPKETLERMAENNPRRKPCCIETVHFMSAPDASRKLNIPVHQIRRRCESDKEEWKDWNYIENPNKGK